jgi:HEAT repeat protein
MDRGMAELEQPLPRIVQESIMNAVVGLGDEVVPLLHKKISESPLEIGLGLTLDVLGQLGDPASTTHIIEFHKNYASYQTGVAAIQALKQLKTEDGYSYLGNLLVEVAKGNKKVVNAAFEVVLACQALGEWNSSKAVFPLKQAVHIRDIHGLPEAAIQALARHTDAHQ